MSTQPPIYLGVSQCLLGDNVRHDGNNKKNLYILEILARHFEFYPCCPEVEIGLGVPRETIHLVGLVDSPRLVFTKTDHDITQQMQHYATEKMADFKHLSGYILKKGSPSCGYKNVKIYQEKGTPPKMGQGLFARTLNQAYPLLPIEEEGRLLDEALRQSFLERVYLYHDWNSIKSSLSPSKLIGFHSRYKIALMAHSVTIYRELGQMLSDIPKQNLQHFAQTYIERLLAGFMLRATRKKQTNVLFHLMGYLKKSLTPEDKQELKSLIESYHQGHIPLLVPVVMLRHYFRQFPDPYIQQQSYLHPYADELLAKSA